MDDQNGDFYFLDLAPTREGKRGQIIDFLRESGATNVIADSFHGLLQNLSRDLEAGKYSFDEKTRAVVLAKKRRK